MNVFSPSNWRFLKQWKIESDRTILTTNFSGKSIFIKASSSDKSLLSKQIGYFYQCAEVGGIGSVQLGQKQSLSLDNLILFDWQKYRDFTSYQLLFERSAWIANLTLHIYESIMPIYSDPNIIIPSNNSSSATATTVPNSATSVALLAANANRKGFKITNNSNQDLFIEFGATASIAAFSVRLPKLPGSNVPAVYEGEGYTGAIAGIWQAAGTGGALVREFV